MGTMPASGPTRSLRSACRTVRSPRMTRRASSRSAGATSSPPSDCARWRPAARHIIPVTAAACATATAAITRGRSGLGCSDRSRLPRIVSAATQRRQKPCWKRSATQWWTRRWARSARSSTAIRRTTRAAPRPRPGRSHARWMRGGCSRRRRRPNARKTRPISKRPDRSRPPMPQAIDAEQRRIEESRKGAKNWRRWGPYLSERQWGTVREDYSPGGTAWDYLTHDQARSRAYRWGEDGIAGFSDDRQLLCLSIALWNGRDPILKERLFGLTNGEGSHGEDVKELYYYLDAVPSHAYARMLYKLPQAAYPYQWLVEENARRRGSAAMEFELIDTRIFDDDRYFDVEVEYAKADADDVLMRITVHNRGPEQASIHILPQIWFRDIWSWSEGVERPVLKDQGAGVVRAEHKDLGVYAIAFETPDRLLFCDNETNFARLFGVSGAQGYCKDAFHEYVIQGRVEAVNPAGEGTKAGGLYVRAIPPYGSTTIRLRLRAGEPRTEAWAGFDKMVAQRKTEADAFYAAQQTDIDDEDMRRIQRQAFAGMLWSKQFYDFKVRRWLEGDPAEPPPPDSRKHGRNSAWAHLIADDIMSMPDKWEYPWFAAWDLAFHC